MQVIGAWRPPPPASLGSLVQTDVSRPDLADVGFGPAFYMFGALVVLVIAQDRFLCKWSVWNSLEQPKKS